MSPKVGSVTRDEARELKRRSEELDRRRGIPHAVVRAKWVAKLGRELREMVRAYDGSARKARELLEAILVAEAEGVTGIDEIRRQLAAKVNRLKRAA
jgi:hypothetical protein